MLIYLFNVLIFPGLIFSLAMGLTVEAIDRKIGARMQRRMGPPILQPLYDLLKLWGKKMMIPSHIPESLFSVIPMIGLAALVTVLLFLPIGAKPVFTVTGDLLVILYLITIPGLMTILGASLSGSPYSSVGLSREMVMLLSGELPLAVNLLTVALFVGKAMGTGIELSLAQIYSFQINHFALFTDWRLWPALLSFLLILPAEAGYSPFDLAEAETEICEGVMAEYSGRNLALFHLAHRIKTFVLIALFVALFLSGILVSDYGLMVNVTIFLIKVLLIMLVFITWVRTSTARIKIEQAVRYFWTYPLGLSVSSLILVLVTSV
jgi:NADH-quinone oxidoreductase subunit H